MSKRIVSTLLLSFGLISGAAQATLHDRGSGLIYDDVLNITWLQDANYAKTSGYDSDGLMTWHQATTWASNLAYFDNVRNTTWTDWRLPLITDDPIVEGYGITSSKNEMAHMYYVSLGLERLTAIGHGGIGSLSYKEPSVTIGLIENIVAHDYWTGTSLFGAPNYAWSFDFTSGALGGYHKAGSSAMFSEIYYDRISWAVRDGDVGEIPNNIPEPGTAVLVLLGLVAASSLVTKRNTNAKL